MMWSPILVLLYLPCSLGLDELTIEFTIDYFQHRNVKHICLFVRKEETEWYHKLATTAMNNSMFISQVTFTGSSDQHVLEKCFEQKFTSVGIFLDVRYETFEKITRVASENMWFNAMYKWLIIDEYTSYTEAINSIYNNNESFVYDLFNNTIIDANVFEENATITLETIFENLNISVDTDISVLKLKDHLRVMQTFTSAEGVKYDLYEVYNFGKQQGGNLIIKPLSKWNADSGFSSNLNNYKYYNRWNFQQWTMRMAIVTKQPEKFDPKRLLEVKPTPGIAAINKISALVLNELSILHNFRFNYTTMNTWIGDFSRNAKVVATALYFREQDISPVIRAIKEINENIDLAHPPLTSIETRYYYRIPTTGPGKLENQFLRPLSEETWLYVMAIILLCIVLLSVTAILERRPSATQFAFFSVWASFCQQFFDDSGDQDVKKTSTARKMTVFVTGLSCVLIYNYYTSSVVSWLLSGPPPSITSLEELLESPLELIFEDIGYSRSWLQVPTYYFNKRNAKVEDKLKKKVYRKKEDAPLLVSLDDGIEMVKAGGYAYHTEANSANQLISRKFTQTELCELGSLQSMDVNFLYVAIQKKSPYKEFLVWGLTRLKERGIVSCIQRRIESVVVQCEGSSPRALALGGAAPAFLVLFAGFVLSFVILILERLTMKLKKKHKFPSLLRTRAKI